MQCKFQIVVFYRCLGDTQLVRLPARPSIRAQPRTGAHSERVPHNVFITIIIIMARWMAWSGLDQFESLSASTSALVNVAIYTCRACGLGPCLSTNPHQPRVFQFS